MVNIKTLWESQKPTGDIIIKSRIEDIPHLNCYAATNHITGQHLYIMSVSKNAKIPELTNYHFKGVEIFPIETEDFCELYIYLLDNDLKDIFSLFIQNILEDITESVTENEAITKTLNVISKWKKLFDKINFNGLTIEQQKGLIGELLFFNYLLKNNKTSTSILNAWTGADFEDKDFIFGLVGVEIKLTSSKNPKIKITSERQLDAENLNKLFLILYTTEEVKENGFSLNSLIEQTLQNISIEDERIFFSERLLFLGYREDDRDYYNKMYSLKKTFGFTVANDFPKIVKSHLPLGIYDTSYSIELSAVESYILENRKNPPTHLTMDRALQNYIEELKSDVSSLVYSEGEGASFEDKFTEYCIEVFESIGKSEGARVLSYVHPNSQGGIDWKINGYCLKDLFKDDNKKEYFETLDLFITNYRIDSYEHNITKEEYTKSLNQIKRFINSAFKRHIDYIDPSHGELNELIKTIGKQGNDFDRINVHFLINGFSNHDKEKIAIADVDVFVHTWDVSRLFKINESNSTHEPIEIEFEKFSENGTGLQCLQVPNIDKMYDCYLAIVPGEILAKLYKEFSNELLESNVRAFLGQAGKFNKGIRDTIMGKEPYMFLPYNNGLTATAENVETIFSNNQLQIMKINDFQIVNGGQTTASLYHTQKKFKDADLSKIFVQMKLIVIKNKEQKNKEVPNISRFANSQNKVSELDLSSNNPYFIQIENLSRKKYVVNPENKNQSFLWFFERANGQYRETLNKQTPAQQKKFKEQNPSNLKFVKSDVAKLINIWELEPHFVSQGSQKNFIHFIKKIVEAVSKNKLPGENLYRKLIANAILFKTVDKLFGRKNVDAIGDTTYKALVVAYTLSYFHYLTDNRIDLWMIYEEQKSAELVNINLKKLLVFVYNNLFPKYTPEALKNKATWEFIKECNYTDDLAVILQDYLITTEEKVQRENEKEIDTNNVEDAVFLISEIQKMGLKFWDGFSIYMEDNTSKGFDYMLMFDLLKKLREQKNMTSREMSFGKKVLDFVQENPRLVEEIRSLSKLVDKEIIEVKFIYDKLLLLSKDDWKRIVDVASQTNTFNNLEFANIKSVQTSLLKKEIIKEQALIRCFESLQKLKKFGIKV